MDARDFVRTLYRATPPVTFSQVIMNLPASAEHFLGTVFSLGAWSCCSLSASPILPDVFRELPPEQQELPTIHCYMFTKDTTDPCADITRVVNPLIQAKPQQR